MSRNQSFTFPRAPRFPSHYLKIDVPFYNIPSTIKKRSNTLGDKLPIKITSNTPSPQYYSISDTKSQIKKSFGFGRL